MRTCTVAIGLLLSAVVAASPAEAGCTNYGVVVSVGTFRCGTGACENEGAAVWVGYACFGPGSFVGACVDDLCPVRVPQPPHLN